MSDAVAVGTGGASGIGRATVARLVADGFRLAVLDQDGGGASEVADPEGLGLRADVSDARSVDEAVARVLDRFGRRRRAGQQRGHHRLAAGDHLSRDADRGVGPGARREPARPFLVTRAILPTMLDQQAGQPRPSRCWPPARPTYMTGHALVLDGGLTASMGVTSAAAPLAC